MHGEAKIYQIAVIEDNNADVAILRYALQHGDFPYKLWDFPTAERALRALSSPVVQPDLVVTDSVLPQMDLEDLLQRLKCLNNLKGIPIVVLSGTSDPRLVERALALGAADYLLKPSELAEWPAVIQRMKRCLDKPAAPPLRAACACSK